MSYMNVLQIMAHAEELHDATTSELEHTLTSPAVSVPLFIVLNIVIFQVVSRYKKTATIPVLLGVNLLIGVLSYDAMPVVSILAISIGITSALVTSLTLLAR